MSTRHEALSCGQKLLQTQGFNGFSFQDIADSLGIRKASLHYHFKSKQDLALALIEDFQSRFSLWTTKVEQKNDSEQVQLYLELFSSMLQDHKKVCPVGAFCLEIQSLDAEVIRSLQAFFELQRKWLVKRISKICTPKKIDKFGGEEVLAGFIMSSIQGSLLTARLQPSATLAKRTFQSHMKIIVDHLL